MPASEITNLQPLHLPLVSAPSSLDPSLSPTTISIMNPPILPNHSDRKPHLLLCATGSVATIKIPLILSSLSHHTLSIRLILSPSATSFFTGKTSEQPPLSSLSTLPNVEAVYTDEDEWAVPWSRGEKILHIELRRWADIMVIAPLSANSLAKICGGWAEGLVGSVVRAWDTTGELDIVRYPLPSPDEEKEREEEAAECMAEGARTGVYPGHTPITHIDRRSSHQNSMRRKKHIIVAPSMNTAMWKQPITRKHIEVLEGEWGVKNGGWFEVLQPMEKELACGDVGGGAMKDWREIVGVIEDRLNLRNEAQAET